MYLNPSAASWTHEGTSLDSAIESFHRELPDYNTTPLVSLPDLARELGVHSVVVKDESSRFGLPAFKILGASWAIRNAVASKCNVKPGSLEELGKVARARGVNLVACTEGNWGRATARMAKYLGIKSTIFVPKHTELATQYLIAGEGAEVTVVEGDYDESIRHARKFVEKYDGLLVMDVSWEGYEDIPQDVVQGYTTMLAEADRQLQELVGRPPTHVFASVGVGSWAQAVCMHFKTNERRATVVAVEPEKAACLQTSLKEAKIVPITTEETIMNGMNCGTVSFTAWPVLQKGVDVSIAVSDSEAHRDVKYLHAHRVPCGPCGSATLSALKRLSQITERGGLTKDSVVVLFSTEGAREYEVPN